MAGWYDEYLRSDHWRTMRYAKLEQTDYHCERCGFAGKKLTGDLAGGLHVHHLTYERQGREELSDLEVLCGWCHAEEHSIKKWRDRDHWNTANTDQKLRLVGVAVDEITLEIEAWDHLADEATL